MKEDVAQVIHKNESLRELADRQEQQLAKLKQSERDLEETRAEAISLKLTNEEYRKTLKAKVSAISELKRELD